MSSPEIGALSEVLGHASAASTFAAYSQAAEVAEGGDVGPRVETLGHTSVAGTSYVYSRMRDTPEKPAP